jgi:hypothetical protein
MSDVSGPLTPHNERIGVHTLLFAVIVAPAFWIGQLIFAYSVSAQACYGSDHPTTLASAATLRITLIVFDVAALVAALVGLVVSSFCWRAVRGEVADRRFDVTTSEGRARFMAIWGIFSSLAFLCAIVFNVIASLVVPLCQA